MTFSPRAIEAAARALCVQSGDDPDKLTYAHAMQCTGHDREPKFTWQYWMPFAEAALTAALAVDGMALVDQRALDWIFGEGPDRDGEWFGETIGDGVPKLAGKYPRTYWWRSKFRAMLAAASDEPAPALQGWQDISTAPKDGTPILWSCGDDKMSVIHWPEYDLCFEGGYWMPLPKPPAASDREERSSPPKEKP